MIAAALLAHPAQSYDISRVSIRISNDGNFPVNLSLAAINASIVAMCADVPDCECRTSHRRVVPLRLRCMNNDTLGPFVDSFAIRVHETSGACSATTDLQPCLCMGIVRAIDISQRKLEFVHPPDEFVSVAYDTNNLTVIRGSQQLPNILYSLCPAPLQVYMTSDSVGEGSGAKQTRGNVKRRSQHS
jgi:hypothetical protein